MVSPLLLQRRCWRISFLVIYCFFVIVTDKGQMSSGTAVAPADAHLLNDHRFTGDPVLKRVGNL